MILSPLEDLAAICGASQPGQLWRHLVGHPTLRAYYNDFDAVVAFKTLHVDGATGAERTAALLCTDSRWRRVTATLIVRIEESGLVTAAKLDALANEFLWDERLRWRVPHAWVRDGLVRVLDHAARRRGPVYLERIISPPLRRWAAARIVRQDPHRAADVLARIAGLDARAGDAAMVGLLDACDRLPAPACSELVDLGCEWPNGTVRLRALELLAAHQPNVAAARAAVDSSDKVRSWAGRLRGAQRDTGAATVGMTRGARAAASDASAPQLALFA